MSEPGAIRQELPAGLPETAIVGVFPDGKPLDEVLTELARQPRMRTICLLLLLPPAPAPEGDNP